MTSVSRVSRTKKRVHNSFVERSREIMNTNGVDRVSPSERTHNNTNNPSANHLIASDEFYDNIRRLKEEYYSFYHDEMKLEKAIKNFQSDKEYISKNMEELLKRYNMALKSLEILDNEFETDHNKRIKNIVKQYKQSLLKLGIEINDNDRLDIDINKFISFIEKSKDLENEINPVRELILKLYKNFKSIKVPKDNSFDTYNNEEIEYSGVLIDKKS